MDDNKIARLELEISSKSDWTAKGLEPDFGALTPQDFVNIHELGNLYMDLFGWDNCDEGFAKLGELTGLDHTLEFKISPTYSTSLLGLYDTIGALIASDREYQALTPDERFKRDQTADAFLEVQEEVRKSPELRQILRDAIRRMLDDNK
jgi:hypothetical protein